MSDQIHTKMTSPMDTAPNQATATTITPKPEYELVHMLDGRRVEFAGKRVVLKTGLKNENGTLSLRLDFRNGESRTVQLNPDLMEDFALHGAAQKYGDATAGLTDLEDMVMAVDDMEARLSEGNWNAGRRAGESLAGASVLVRALVEVYKQPVEAVKARVSGFSQAQKLAMRAMPQLADVIARIEAEKKDKNKGKGKEKPAIDVAGLLALFEG